MLLWVNRKFVGCIITLRFRVKYSENVLTKFQVQPGLMILYYIRDYVGFVELLDMFSSSSYTPHIQSMKCLESYRQVCSYCSWTNAGGMAYWMLTSYSQCFSDPEDTFSLKMFSSILQSWFSWSHHCSAYGSQTSWWGKLIIGAITSSPRQSYFFFHL